MSKTWGRNFFRLLSRAFEISDENFVGSYHIFNVLDDGEVLGTSNVRLFSDGKLEPIYTSDGDVSALSYGNWVLDRKSNIVI